MSTVVNGQTFAGKIPKDGGTHSALLSGVKDTIYTNCQFVGDGVRMDFCNGVTLGTGCVISGARRTSNNHQAIYMSADSGGNQNVTIDGLTITDCTAAAQLYAVQNLIWRGGVIGGDTLGKGVNYGIKGSVGGCKNWLFDGILFKRDRAMAVELQYDDVSTDSIRVRNCAYAEAERWSVDPYPGSDTSSQNSGPTMAFSTPFTVATNVVIENNYAGGPVWLIDKPGQQRVTGPDWIGIRVGAEFGGKGVILRNNWFDRINRAGSLIKGSSNWNVGPNLVVGCTSGVYMDGSTPFTNCNSSVVLTGPGGWTLVGLTPPGSAPIPPEPPLPLPPKLTHTLDIFSDGSFKVRP